MKRVRHPAIDDEPKRLAVLVDHEKTANSGADFSAPSQQAAAVENVEEAQSVPAAEAQHGIPVGREVLARVHVDEQLGIALHNPHEGVTDLDRGFIGDERRNILGVERPPRELQIFLHKGGNGEPPIHQIYVFAAQKLRESSLRLHLVRGRPDGTDRGAQTPEGAGVANDSLRSRWNPLVGVTHDLKKSARPGTLQRIQRLH